MNCSHNKNSRHRRWRIVGGLVLVGFSSCITGEIFLETAPIKIAGTAGDRAGYALDISGDLNGDGYDDLVMAAPQIGVEEVYVFFGPIPAGDLSTATPDAVFRGLSGGEAGWAVATRDVTGNGSDDLIIAAPSENGGVGLYTYSPGLWRLAGSTLATIPTPRSGARGTSGGMSMRGTSTVMVLRTSLSEPAWLPMVALAAARFMSSMDLFPPGCTT
ncbi:MAG: FG-GAP repeat protein [Nannocystaceae bacterium]|nr:FG-GAP repeat protein [Nannocystaceae bacterium]